MEAMHKKVRRGGRTWLRERGSGSQPQLPTKPHWVQ